MHLSNVPFTRTSGGAHPAPDCAGGGYLAPDLTFAAADERFAIILPLAADLWR